MKLSTHIYIAISLIVLILMLISSITIGVFTGNSMRKKVEQALSETAFHMADKMDQFMWSRSGELYTISALEPMKTLDNVDEITELLNRLKLQFPSFSWIGVTDVNGTVIAATDDILKGGDISQRPVYQQGIKGEYIGDVHEAVLLADLLPNPTGELMQFVDISFPLTDNSGNTIGVIAAHLSWEWAREVRATVLEPIDNDQIEIFVVSAVDGSVLLGDEAQIGKMYESDKSRFIEASSIADGYLNYNGLNWTIYVRQDKTTALSSVHYLQWVIWSIGAVLFIVFVLLGRYYGKAISKPLDTLIKALDQARFGEKPALPTHKGVLEIERLSETLHELFDALNINMATINTLENVVNTDNLTGISNRTGLKNYFDLTTRHYKQLSVLSIDLDGFKQINDQYGHEAGDFVLCEVAKRLQMTIRDHEIVARIGGDEFVVLLIPNETPLDIGSLVARRIIDVINKPFIFHSFSLQVGCSIGCSSWNEGETLKIAIQRSDEALYRAKSAGKNRFEN
ncbi:MAG: hypothetical protein BGO41_11890 [Clostridiales bacterium 38-18]|nr:MAG: hypothetical protein BGO41_11890 [Clostridiales bacterium 38-18]